MLLQLWIARIYHDLNIKWVTEGLSLRVICLPGTLNHTWNRRRCEHYSKVGIGPTARWIECHLKRGIQVCAHNGFESIAIIPITASTVLDKQAFIYLISRVEDLPIREGDIFQKCQVV